MQHRTLNEVLPLSQIVYVIGKVPHVTHVMHN